jgi:hypothetical protein
MEEYDFTETDAYINWNLAETITESSMSRYDFDVLKEINSDAINMLEKTLNQDEPNQKVIDLCNKTIDKILSAYGINFKVTK